MSEAPERIWWNVAPLPYSYTSTVQFAGGVEYVRADRIEELEAKLTTCEKYRDAYAECDRIGTQTVRDLEAKLKEAAMNEVIILGQAQEAYEQVAELKAKLAKALTALGDVQRFVKELEPYADQGHTLVPALQKACDVYVELTGDKDE